MKKRLAVLLLCFMLFMDVSPIYAEHQPFRLLKRGFTNILTSPLEIPKQTIMNVKETAKKTPHISAAIFVGLVRGIVDMVGRMGSGFYDVLTSSFDTSGDSLVKPPCIFEDWR